MKLNPDCMRDLLLYLEDKLSVSESKLEPGVFSFDCLTLKQISQDLPSYSSSELVNTIITLNDGGFIITAVDKCGAGICHLDVNQITYRGYQFIKKIRPETVWSKVKNACTHVGSFSIDLVSLTGTRILSSLATSYLGL